MKNNNTKPDFNAFHKSVTEELYSIKDRIRNLVNHWPTDGESKEVALRSILRRHLPSSVIVGRGFVVTERKSSTQIDVLIIDASKPTLFREGDLFIVTPDVVMAVIEVKTELSTAKEIKTAIMKLMAIEKMCSDVTGKDSIWTGLFTYNENKLGHQKLLKAVGDAYAMVDRPINCIALGMNSFVRFWSCGAKINSNERGSVWHAYDIPGIAPSYFIGNLIDAIGSLEHPSAGFAWFPLLGGKEQHRTHYLSLGDSKPIAY